MKGAILALAFAASTPPQIGKTSIQVFTFPDDDSCASWSMERAKSVKSQALEGWILGFVSGRNSFGSGNGLLGGNTNATALIAWVDLYCSQHPLDSVTTAGFKLVKELERRG